MNKVILLCLALALTSIFFAIIYFVPFFSKKKIKEGKFDLLQFFNLFFSPIFVLPIFYFLRVFINSNPQDLLINIPRYVSEIGFMLVLYLLILGHGIHSVSVVLSKNMKDLTNHKVWKINEFFHNAFSHMLITGSAVLILFTYAIGEINRPGPIMTNPEIIIIITGGVVTGIILGLASIEGAIPKMMFYLLYACSIILSFFFFKFDLDFRHFPFTTFTETAFIVAIVTMTLYRQIRKGFPEIVPQYFFD